MILDAKTDGEAVPPGVVGLGTQRRRLQIAFLHRYVVDDGCHSSGRTAAFNLAQFCTARPIRRWRGNEILARVASEECRTLATLAAALQAGLSKTQYEQRSLPHCKRLLPA